MIRVAVAGITGNLGSAIASMIGAAPDMAMGGTAPGQADPHILIDVSCPESVMRNALECVKARRPIVVGVSGLDPNHLAELEEYSRRIPVFYTTNFCIETATVMSLLPLIVERMLHLCVEVSGMDEHRRRHAIEILNGTLAMPQATNDPVIFLVGADQEIMLCQRVLSLEAHARGALNAVRFLVRHHTGFFTIDDLVRQPAKTSLIPAASSTMVGTR